MITSTREHLLGYLLGALEADEQAAVEQALSTSSQLCEELELLRQRVQPLDALRSEEDNLPPPGLATRTVDSIFGPPLRRTFSAPLPDRHDPLVPEHFEGGQEPARDDLIADRDGSTADVDLEYTAPVQLLNREPMGADASSARRWSSSDWVVVGGLCIALLVMLAPALHSSQEMARRLACQNKLRTLGDRLARAAGYSSNQSFPAIPTEPRLSFAGMLAPQLHDMELLPDPQLLVCPSDRINVSLYSMPELLKATAPQLAIIRETALGSMGYNLGVIVEGQYQPPRNLNRSGYALMAEIPRAGGITQGNHGHGRNVLFEDQHVEYVVLPHRHGGDNPFANHFGKIEAGIGIDDAVVGPSHASPLGAPIVPVTFNAR